MALELREVAFRWTIDNYPTDTIQHTTVAIGMYSEDQEENDDDIFFYFPTEDDLNQAYSTEWADSMDFVLVKESN